MVKGTNFIFFIIWLCFWSCGYPAETQKKKSCLSLYEPFESNLQVLWSYHSLKQVFELLTCHRLITTTAQQSGPCKRTKFLLHVFFFNKNTGLHRIDTTAHGIFQHRWRQCWKKQTNTQSNIKQWKTWSVLIRGNAQKARFDLLHLADSQVLPICWVQIQLHSNYVPCVFNINLWQTPADSNKLERMYFHEEFSIIHFRLLDRIKAKWTDTVFIQLVHQTFVISIHKGSWHHNNKQCNRQVG